MDQHKPSHQMTVRGKIGDHPRGNYWFADQLAEDEEDYHPQFPWRVFIQLAGMVDHLDACFPSKEAAEAYIRDDILGAGADIAAGKTVPGEVVTQGEIAP